MSGWLGKKEYLKKDTNIPIQKKFKVTKVIQHDVPVYEIKDLNDEIIDGHFYEAELLKVIFNPNAEFKIDKIIQSKGKGISKKLLVSWKGYPPAFNSWILAKDLKLL